MSSTRQGSPSLPVTTAPPQPAPAVNLARLQKALQGKPWGCTDEWKTCYQLPKLSRTCPHLPPALKRPLARDLSRAAREVRVHGEVKGHGQTPTRLSPPRSRTLCPPDPALPPTPKMATLAAAAAPSRPLSTRSEGGTQAPPRLAARSSQWRWRALPAGQWRRNSSGAAGRPSAPPAGRVRPQANGGAGGAAGQRAHGARRLGGERLPWRRQAWRRRPVPPPAAPCPARDAERYLGPSGRAPPPPSSSGGAVSCAGGAAASAPPPVAARPAGKRPARG